MAILEKPAARPNMFDLPDAMPAKGTFVATCIDVKDVFGTERRKFQSEETEKVDLTCFLFGYRDAAGNPHKITSKTMKISGNPKSSLFNFLKSWLGHAPEYGWDYMELKGKTALVTVDHEARRSGDGEFAYIVSISPVPEGFTPATTASAAPASVAPAAEDDSLPF